MAHITNVSAAIQAVLSSIKCLRALVKIIQNPDLETNNPSKVYARLLESFPKIDLSLAQQKEFYVSLTVGMMTMNAATLLDYYDSLSGKLKGKGSPQEWTP